LLPPPPKEKVRHVLNQLATLPQEAEEKINSLDKAQKKIRELEGKLRQTPQAIKQIDKSEIDNAILRTISENERLFNAHIKPFQRLITQREQTIQKAVDLLTSSLKDSVPSESMMITLPKPDSQTIKVQINDRTIPIRENKKTSQQHNGNALATPQQKIIDALAWWTALGFDTVSREQVAFVAGYTPNGGYYTNQLGACRTQGLLEYPSDGSVRLTNAGEKIGHRPSSLPTSSELYERIVGVLETPQERIFTVLWNDRELSREGLSSRAGYKDGGGYFNNQLGRLRTLKLCDYPSPGYVKLSQWIVDLQY
jgi:hypothetical protein